MSFTYYPDTLAEILRQVEVQGQNDKITIDLDNLAVLVQPHKLKMPEEAAAVVGLMEDLCTGIRYAYLLAY